MELEFIKSIARRYAEPENISEISGGHINQTYHVQASRGDFILQRINTSVFKNPELLDENLRFISGHLSKISYPYQVAQVIRTHDNKSYIQENDSVWRATEFITGGRTFEKTRDLSMVEKTGIAFGEFSKSFLDIEPAKIRETIESFHNPEMRFNAFMAVLENTREKELAPIQSTIEHAIALNMIVTDHQKIIETLPLRITHNDAKIGNVLFDESNNIKAIIDLDTVMPGYLMHDFGDMARSMCNPSAEDEQNLSGVIFDEQVFKALSRGYLSVLEPHITDEEILSLIPGIKSIIYTQFLRFLTDHIQGNIYYSISYPDQNLRRAKVQVNLLLDFLNKERKLENYLEQIVHHKS